MARCDPKTARVGSASQLKAPINGTNINGTNIKGANIKSTNIKSTNIKGTDGPR
jgi:hypothetical protein